MIKVADEIWLATALLHKEHPKRNDFSIHEIIARAMQENLAGGYRPGLPVHASNHCVADKPPNPAHHCMLHETGRGRRRLFRAGDPCHPFRKGGKTHPTRADLPPRYAYLVDWYETEYARGNGNEWQQDASARTGTAGKDLLSLAGTINKGELRRMSDAIAQDCERVDLNEW